MQLYCTKRFKRELTKLLKKKGYESCSEDIQNEIEGHTVVSFVKANEPPLRVVDNSLFLKLRTGNSKQKKGQSGGYRVYVYVQVLNQNVYLLSVYPKAGAMGIPDISKGDKNQLLGEVHEEIANDTIELFKFPELEPVVRM